MERVHRICESKSNHNRVVSFSGVSMKCFNATTTTNVTRYNAVRDGEHLAHTLYEREIDRVDLQHGKRRCANDAPPLKRVVLKDVIIYLPG